MTRFLSNESATSYRSARRAQCMFDSPSESTESQPVQSRELEPDLRARPAAEPRPGLRGTREQRWGERRPLRKRVAERYPISVTDTLAFAIAVTFPVAITFGIGIAFAVGIAVAQ